MKFVSKRSGLALAAALTAAPLIGALVYGGISLAREARRHPDLDAEVIRLASLPSAEIPAFIQNTDRSDLVSEYYRDTATQRAVVEFFAELTHSESIAQSILSNAERYGVPPTLAFALAYEESRFKVAAVNDNGDSIDRGLFQLNSKAFPDLGPEKVFNPDINARYGLSHLDYFLRTSGNEVAALAMYNAGMHRVTKSGTPRRTLDYIYRILSYERNISSLFAARVIAQKTAREKSRIGLMDLELATY